MKHARSGSCIIVILISLSIILLACGVLLQSSVFFKRLTATRLKESQAELVLLGLMQYGISIAKDNYARVMSNEFDNQEAVLCLVLEEGLEGRITMQVHKPTISIKAFLQGPGSRARSAVCTVCLQEQDQKLLISGFQM